MNETTNSAAASEPSLVASLFVILIAVAVYIFVCYCLKRICEKCGKQPGVLIWIPIVQFIPLLQIAGMSPWLLILFFIPLANLIVAVIMWVKICQARGKSPWLVLLMFVPIANLIFIPYLAFSE